MKRIVKKIISGILSVSMIFSIPVFTYAADNSAMTGQEIVDNMGVGWCLGNALDSEGGETNWGNPATTKAMIDAVKAAGFNTVRIPVTWYYQCDNNGKISANWLKRVKEVVDYCYNNDMYVIINLHHENDKIIPDSAHKDSSIAWIKNLWTQIAPYFKDYDHHLIFESMNEPRIVDSDDEWTTGTYETRQIISEFNQAAVDTIRATGGNNATRLIMCPSNAAKIPASSGFTLPNDKNIALSVHHYNPYEFAMNGKGTSSWGSDNDKTTLNNELKGLYNRYVSKGIPVVIGEMGATNKNNDADRAKWAEYYVNTAKSYGITCVVWDNNVSDTGEECFGLLNRSKCTWYFPDVVKAYIKGIKNVKPYVPSTSTGTTFNETVIFSGSVTKDEYENLFKSDSVPYLTDGYKIAVSYSGDVPPYLVFQDYDTGEWNQIKPDNIEEGIAYYSYEHIASNIKSSLANQKQIIIMADGVTTTLTKIAVIAPKGADMSAYSTVIFEGSASAGDYEQPYSSDDVPYLEKGYEIAVTYSGEKSPRLVFQNTSALEWNDNIYADRVVNGVAYYTYDNIVKNLKTSLEKQNRFYVQSNGAYTTVSKITVIAPPKTGDVNYDGKADTVDAALVLRAINTSNLINIGDMNNDKTLNLLDVILILKTQN